MVKYVSHIMSGNTLTVIFQGRDPISIPREDTSYDKVLQLIRDGKYDAIPGAADNALAIEEQYEGFAVKGNTVTIDGQALPYALSKRIIHLAQYELDVKPLLNFWNNVRTNPSENSREDLYGFLEANHYPITEDGCFVGYKSVTPDFLDIHTKKIDNSPGKTVTMPRANVDPNRHNTCSSGLHVAAYPYATGFGGGKNIVEVKVNPADVVTVPTDYEAQKMRCCKYEVVRVNRKVRREQVYSGKKQTMNRKKPTGGASGIRRLPADQKRVFPDGRGAISIATSLFERLNIKAGDKVYLYVSTQKARNFRVSKLKPKGSPHFLKEMNVGKVSTRIFSNVMKVAQIDGGEYYELAFNKGDLVVR